MGFRDRLIETELATAEELKVKQESDQVLCSCHVSLTQGCFVILQGPRSFQVLDLSISERLQADYSAWCNAVYRLNLSLQISSQPPCMK